jgi:hypothetical protein
MIFGAAQRTATPANSTPFHEYEHEPEPETVAQRSQQERQN